MKKLLALSVVLSFLAVSAFAEISVTGEFDAALIPLQVLIQDSDKADANGEEAVAVGAGLGRSGNADAPRARIGVTAATPDGKIGLNFKIQFNANKDFRVAFDDFAEVWVKPIDWLRIDVGRFTNDTLRGKIGDDNWSNYTATMKNADEIFTRFKGQWYEDQGGGFLISLTPLEGLFIGVSVPGLISFDKSSSSAADQIREKAAYAYQRIQVGAGYEIKGIGHARLQYVGNKPSVSGTTTQERVRDPITGNFVIDPNTGTYQTRTVFNYDVSGYGITAPKIELAFALTAVENLVLDLGIKIPIPFDEWTNPQGIWTKEPDPVAALWQKDVTYQAPIQISLGAGYTMGDLDIKGRIDTKFAGRVEPDKGDTINLPFILNLHLWPSYNLGMAIIGLDFGLEYTGETTKDGDVINDLDGGVRVGFGLWAKKTFGASSIKGGLAYRVGTEVNNNKEVGAFTIPIIFEYSF